MLTVLPVGEVAEAEPQPFIPRPSIMVLDSAQLGVGPAFNPTMGVVSGSGTQADPYVISGWEFTMPPGWKEADPVAIPGNYAIVVSNLVGPATGVHPWLIIENNYIHDMVGGISVSGVSHVTIRENLLVNVGHAIDINEATDVLVHGNLLIGVGNGVSDGTASSFESDYDVTGNTMIGTGSGFGIRALSGFGSGNVFSNNDISGFGYGIRNWDNSAHVTNNDLHGNTYGLYNSCCARSVVDNQIYDNGVGIGFYRQAFTTGGVHGNNFWGNSGYAMDAENWHPGNIIEGLYDDNWFNSSDGPSGHGPGSGDAIRFIDSSQYTPWLTSPNPEAGATLPEYPEPLLALL